MIEEKEIESGVKELADEWLEQVDARLPAEIAAGKEHGNLDEGLLRKRIRLGVRKWPDGCEVFIKSALRDTLREVFAQAADVLGERLLPPAPQAPLDALRYHEKHDEWSLPITNLNQPLWLALVHGVTRHLAIEYKLTIKINTRWGIAPSSNATPRELLTSFGMSPDEFSLYKTDSVDPLPPDTPLSIRRGECFEAQKDGKYGSIAIVSSPRGSQTIEEDVEGVNEAGINARLIAVGSQKYVEVCAVDVPSPPWGREQANILIAIPATYPSGALDGFYLELPFTHAGGSIPRQQQIVAIDGRNWALISWHYHESRPWSPSHDDLTTHIENCRGFFLARGVRG